MKKICPLLYVLFLIISFTLPLALFGQGLVSNDTLKVSIYFENIAGVDQYIRVSDYSINSKKEFMYYNGKLYSGIYGEYYPCTENFGKLRRHGIIRDGKPEGIFKGYYENGQLCIEEHFNKGILTSAPTCMDYIGNVIDCNRLSFIKPLTEEQYWNQLSYGHFGSSTNGGQHIE